MGEALHVEGLAPFARALEAGAATLRARVAVSLRGSGMELSKAVPEAAARELPKRGGFAAKVADALGLVTVSGAGGEVAVSIVEKTRQGYQLAPVDRGVLAHPVFNHRAVWVDQKVPAGTFSHPFYAGAPKVARSLRTALQEELDAIAQEASRGI